MTVLNIFSKISFYRKPMLKFIWNTWKYWLKDTDGEILPIFAKFFWTLKFISLTSKGKLLLVLFQANNLSLTFRKCKKDCNYSGIPVHLKLKLLDFLLDFAFEGVLFIVFIGFVSVMNKLFSRYWDLLRCVSSNSTHALPLLNQLLTNYYVQFG